MRRLSSAAAVLSSILAISCLVVSCASSDKVIEGSGPVVIGLITDLSAEGAQRGNDILKGAKLHAEALNRAGGVEGRQVRVEALDMKESTTDAVKSLNRLARENHASAVVDASFFRAGFVLGSASDSLGIALVSVGTDDRVTTPEMFESEGNTVGVLRRFAFLMRPTASQIASAIAQYAAANFPITRYATLSDPADALSTIQAQSFARAARKAGKLIVASEELSGDQDDTSAPLQRIMAASPEAVFICGSMEQNARAAQDAQRLGLDALLLGNENWDGHFLELAGGSARNAWFAADISPDERALESIASVFQERFGDAPRQAVLLGWDAVGLVVSAVLRAGSLDPEKVANSLEQTRGFVGMLGTLSIDPATHRADGPPVAIMRILQGRRIMVEPWYPVMP